MGGTNETIQREVGEVLGGRFRLDRPLGKGGMGSVLAATDQRNGRRVALKLMRSAAAAEPSAVERFKREAAILRAIDHSAVVAVEDAGRLPDGTLYLAMELLEGRTLRRRLKEDGPMPLPLVVPVVRGLCDALTAVHAAGVVHRDVKPSNIFLPESRDLERASLTGESVLVKLVDFGVAKVYGAPKLTQEGLTVGTARYMAPEQLAGVENLDGRVDVYSVGVVLYEMLTGVHPFLGQKDARLLDAIVSGDRPDVAELRPELGPEVAEVVARAMARQREDRFSTPAQLASRLTRAVLSPKASAVAWWKAETRLARPAVRPSDSPASDAHTETFLGDTISDADPSASAVRRAIPPTRVDDPAPAQRESTGAGESAAVDDSAAAELAASVRQAARSNPPSVAPSAGGRRWAWIALLVVLLSAGGIALTTSAGLGLLTGEIVREDELFDDALGALRPALAGHPRAAEYHTSLSRLEALHVEGATNEAALSALDHRVHLARSDGRIDQAELEALMEIVRDIAVHGGEFSEAYSEHIASGGD